MVTALFAKATEVRSKVFQWQYKLSKIVCMKEIAQKKKWKHYTRPMHVFDFCWVDDLVEVES